MAVRMTCSYRDQPSGAFRCTVSTVRLVYVQCSFFHTRRVSFSLSLVAQCYLSLVRITAEESHNTTKY